MDATVKSVSKYGATASSWLTLPKALKQRTQPAWLYKSQYEYFLKCQTVLLSRVLEYVTQLQAGLLFH